MIGVLFLCLISTRNALSQNVAWSVATSLPRFNELLNLTCSVDADCCSSSSRIWEDGTGAQILNDGVSSKIDKYEEDWDGGTAGFNLIIKNLQPDEVGVDYNCRYKFGNDKHTLTQDATWEYVPREKCQMDGKIGSGKISGKIGIPISSSLPLAYAEFGDKNVTMELAFTGLVNFDTWFYRWTISIDAEVDCKTDTPFTLKIVTGTTTTKICDSENICECLNCGFICQALSLAIPFIGFIVCFCISCGKVCLEKGCAKMRVLKIPVIHICSLVVLNGLITLVIVLADCPCNDTLLWLFLLGISAITGVFTIVIIHHFFFKFDLTVLLDTSLGCMEKSCLVILFVLTGGTSLLIASTIDKKWLIGTGTEEDPVKVYVKQGCEVVLKHTIKNAKEGWAKQIGDLWKTIALEGKEGYRVSTKSAWLNKTCYTLCVMKAQPNHAGIYRCAGDYYFKLILSANSGKDRIKGDEPDGHDATEMLRLQVE